MACFAGDGEAEAAAVSTCMSLICMHACVCVCVCVSAATDEVFCKMQQLQTNMSVSSGLTSRPSEPHVVCGRT